MEKLSTELLVFCDYATTSNDGKLSVIGIFDRIFTTNLPSHYGRHFLVAIIKGMPGSKHELSMELTGPDGNVVLRAEKLVLVFGQNGKANMVSDVAGMKLVSVGKYELIIKEDNNLVGSTELYVTKTDRKAVGKKQLN
jgi:hypothetical protein